MQAILPVKLPVMERRKIMMEEKEVQMVKHYPKYKPSGVDWIGEIPEHWEIKKIKYCFKYTTGWLGKYMKDSEKNLHQAIQ